MRDLFAADANRFAAMHETLHGLLFDYSKNRITEETLTLLCNLADSAQVKQRMQAMRRGDKINTSENRASLHIALRLPENAIPSLIVPFRSPEASLTVRTPALPANALPTLSTSASAVRI